MAGPVSFVQTKFNGGEISQSAQGAMEDPSYKISMNACINWVPMETGSLQRRPGSRHIAPARGGKTGKIIAFTFEESFPYQMEFTDGFMRFTTGPSLVMTNDQQAILAISSANPAVIQTATTHGWSSGNSVMLNSLGINNPLLQNRQFTIAVVDPTHVSISDALTGATINGSSIGAFVSGNVTRILEIATTYAGGTWSSVRSVQAENRTMLLNGTHSQVLQVVRQPNATQFATFTLGAADFLDGPYLDPVPRSQATPSGLNGVITLTLTFQVFDVTKAYNTGDFVSFSGLSWKAINASVGNTPSNNPGSAWVNVNAGAAINGGLGFVSSDIGRLVRLLSEPSLWNASQTYATGNIVAYADGNGGFSYWTATGAVAANVQPGTSTAWAINATGAIWTWGQIQSVTGSALLPAPSPIGTLTSHGGLASAFDGNTTKAFGSSATASVPITTYPQWGPVNWGIGARCQYQGVGYNTLIAVFTSSTNPVWASNIQYGVGVTVQYNGTIYISLIPNGPGILPSNQPVVPAGNPTAWNIIGIISTAPPPGQAFWTSLGAMPQPNEVFYIGQHYAAPVTIQSVTVYPTTDVGLANQPAGGATMSVNLRASNSAPTSSSNGTLLGSTGSIPNQGAGFAIPSNDTTSTWNYVWIELGNFYQQPLPDNGSHIFTANLGVSQVQFFSANVNNGSVCTVQIRGPALLYNQTIRTWQLGLYSDTTGWPTCGVYHESRIWLGGVVSNRFDACKSNGLSDVRLDFAPTAPNGTVSDNNAISYTCTGEDSNQFLWMKSEQQGIIAGTQAGEWLISAPSSGAMSPTNIHAVRVTRIGCANAEPRRTEHTLVVIQKFARKLVEFFADVFSGKYTAPDLAERAKHMTVSGIAEIAYQQELAPTLWSRRNDGNLVAATYRRDTLMTSQGPTMIGWYRAVLGSGRAVESISVGPSVGGNLENLSMITNDPNSGIRHLELMTDLLDEGFSLPNCWYLDDAIVPSSTVVQATGGPYGSLLVNGLWDHNGKIVTAFIAGLDCGDYTVTNGSITVPFGDGVSGGTGSGLFTSDLVNSFHTLPAIVGFTYNSDGQLVRPVTPQQTGTQSGPGFAKLGRQHYAAALLYGCVNGSISFGTDFITLDPAKLWFENDVPYPVNQLWSGIWRDQVESIIDFDGMISFRVSRPLPAFIMAVGGFNAKADV